MILDLCIIDDDDKLMDYGQMTVPFLSAHDLIRMTYKIRIERSKNRRVVCRNFKNFNEQDFLADIIAFDWTDLLSTNCIDEKVSIFNDKLMSCLDNHAPLRSITFKKLPAPWLTQDIKDSMHERDLLRRVWRRYRSNENYHKFKTMRNKVQNIIRTAKKKYYLAIFGQKDKPNEIWKNLRHLGLIKSNQGGGRLACTAEEMNAFFSDAGSGLEVDDNQLSDVVYQQDGIFDEKKLYFKYITPDVIRKSLMKIKSNAVGADGISAMLIKMVLPFLMPVIEHLLNFSIMNGVVPLIWKSAIIRPINKIKQPTSVQHYRPISILPTIAKLLERIVSDQIVEYLLENDMLDPYQFAYRKNASTQTCILRMLDDIRQAVDKRKITISVFFDFSKAFDRVRHNVLINKLIVKGFSYTAIKWIHSYLTDRTQAVSDSFEGTTSSLINTIAGVPQDSVLGALLFVLFVSDIGGVIKKCKYNLYADDLQIYLHSEPRNLHDNIDKVNEDIKSLIKWSENNELILNPEKTQAILFGMARYINEIVVDNLPRLKIGDSIVTCSSNVKYLGISITNTLSWEMHVTSVVKNMRSKLYQLKISKHLFTNELKIYISLISTLIIPYLDYCCAALTDITDQLNLKLYRALNACIRFACNVKWDEHVTPYYRRLQWLKIEERKRYFVGSQLVNILKSQQPTLLYENFKFRYDHSARTTRAAHDLLIIPIYRTETYKRSFRCILRLSSGMNFRLRYEL